MPLSASALRRLDEVCDEWAASWCDRWVDRPDISTPRFGGPDAGRQWRTTYELDEEELGGTTRRVHMAIEALSAEHQRTLQTWAWENHYNRGLIRSIQRTECGLRHCVFRSNRVSQAEVDAAKEALAALLSRFNVVLAD